jgi:hypothetical protein
MEKHAEWMKLEIDRKMLPSDKIRINPNTKGDPDWGHLLGKAALLASRWGWQDWYLSRDVKFIHRLPAKNENNEK